MGISIRAKGLDETVLKEMRERLQNPERAMKVSAEQLRGLILRESFGQGRDPQGDPWAPLADSTQRKRGRKSAATLLVDTGQLRGGVTAKAERDVIRVGVSGAAVRYALFHQVRTRKMPARAILPNHGAGNPQIRGGWAQRWAERTRNRHQSYIGTGKVNR
jgi:phage gpG-like protein